MELGNKSQVFLSSLAALWLDNLDWIVWKDSEYELVQIRIVNGVPQYATSTELEKVKEKLKQ